MLYMEQKTEYLTVEQIADALGESESTVRGWIYQKKLTAYKFGKKWKVKREDLEKFIESTRNQ